MSILDPSLASLLGLVAGLIIITCGIFRFGKGIDDRWSLANIQLILWTGVILGSYLALSLSKGAFLSDIPQNTLILIGIASGTLALSSIIKQVQNGDAPTVPPPAPDPKKKEFTGGFLASEKHPDKASFAKMQKFSWNIIAILLFVAFVSSNISQHNYTLPDVGETMSVIIGISNGVYLANKTADKQQT